MVYICIHLYSCSCAAVILAQSGFKKHSVLMYLLLLKTKFRLLEITKFQKMPSFNF